MNIVSSIRERAVRLAACAEFDVEASALPSSAMTLSDASVVDLLTEASALANDVARLQAVLAGVVAQRSQREHGHSGLAAVHGHPTPASLIQSITGGTRADATRHVRVGTDLVDREQTSAGEPDATAPAPWHAVLDRALLYGGLSPAEKDAIRTGLGEPPLIDGKSAPAVQEAWTLAAEALMAEASALPTEELTKRARTMRDLLDPAGAQDRYERRYEKRSFRMWIDDEGLHRARVVFDDEMALWVRSMLDAALRPRRGGPRFVAEDERAAADELSNDSRSNDQLEYDLMMDVLRAGSLARAEDVFGARQPGVRMVVVKDALGARDAFGRLTAVGHAEDGGATLSGSVVERAICRNGSIDVTVDAHGNPLDLGREQRLYSARQRVTLAARDGGCVWPGCTRVASYCEAHHCDHFVAHHGRTDIDRGVLLCPFHHLLLHNRGWRITRQGKQPFVLHPPAGEGPPIALRSKAPWQWAWDPPPPPERDGWRSVPERRGKLA